MLDVSQYDAEKILSPDIFKMLLEISDEFEQTKALMVVQQRAKELKIKGAFDLMWKSLQKKEKEAELACRMTDFVIPIDKMERYKNMKCGSWVANGNGIVSYNIMGMEQRASYQPILPVERLENMQTGEEQIVLAFYRDHKWKEITVSKDVISSSTKIVVLSKYGLSVTSENAKHLVKYLNDVENLNQEDIDVLKSTSKLGWHGTDFIPFDKGIIFDGDIRFKNIFEAITQSGSEALWIEYVKKLRATGRPEIKFMLAASFASVLIKPLGILPFFVDLWGETEGGKSVSLMLACSVWGNPAESQYIGDFKTTDVALEAKADMLNNLPMMLDDTSKASTKIRDNFESVVYDLCSGKGKSRSNKEIGLNRENKWQLCILSNGEHSLTSYVQQGGAINRIIEIEAAEHIYENPQESATFLKNNYGWTGQRFVEEVKKIPNLRERYDTICKQLFSEDKMQKQAMSVACLMLADQIATETIFKDDASISLVEAKNVLLTREEISEQERCYNYVVDKINMNDARFDPEVNCEKWGIVETEWAYIYPAALDQICKGGGFSMKSFVSWASKKGLVILEEKTGKFKQKKMYGKNTRVAYIRLEKDNHSIPENKFVSVEETLPFD